MKRTMPRKSKISYTVNAHGEIHVSIRAEDVITGIVMRIAEFLLVISPCYFTLLCHLVISPKKIPIGFLSSIVKSIISFFHKLNYSRTKHVIEYKTKCLVKILF